MTIHVITEFNAKDGRADDLLALVRTLVPESRHHDGCQEICIRQNQDQPGNIISVQRWASRQHYDSYRAWRTDNGVTAQIQTLLSTPISVRYFRDVKI
jgi:quinol monooxygenase YgiN